MIPVILAFMVCGILNWGYAYLIAFALIVAGYPLLKRSDIMLNFLLRPGFWLLAVFGVLYVAFAGINFTNIQCYVILPLLAYMIGWCGFEQGGRQPETARDNILGIVVGFAVHGCLNYFINQGHNRGQLIDFWSGMYRSATGSGLLNTMIFSVISYTFLLEKRRWLKYLMIALTAVCILYMFILGTRTQMVILGVMMVLGLFLYLGEQGNWKLARNILFAAGTLVLLAMACYHFNVLKFRDFLDGSNLIARFLEKEGLKISNSERVEQFLIGLRNLYEYPLGGQKEQYYYHNMWLDISRIAGLIPMILMLAFNLMTLVHALRVFSDREIDSGTRYVILCVYLGVLLNCFMEPVLEGLLSLFLAFCVINGITESLYFHRSKMIKAY